MFGTPDFGHSDLWHFNFALKHFLSEALKNGYLPLWSKDIGTGFPVFAEGQVGIFNVFNLFFFKFFSPVLAFNLELAVIFLTTAAGAYLFGRAIKLSRLSSFFLAVTFSLSGIFVTHLVHFNLIQAVSFLPWLFFLTEKWLQTGRKRFLTVFALILSQQIYSGFQQVVMISLLGLGIYTLGRARQLKSFRRLLFWSLAVLTSFVLAAPQLLASAQLVRESFRSGGVPLAEMVRFPFPPLHLLSFIYPYILGDPRQGTYPYFSQNWGIFWESTGYIGLIPVILAASLAIKRKIPLIWSLLAIVSLILLLGKYTPFFFIFQLPPLSFFRVPARFLILFSWSLAVIAAIGLNRIRNPLVKIIIFIIAIIDISYFAAAYNAVIDPKIWLTKPASVKFLENDKSWFRVSSLFPYVNWNNIYLKRGWQNMAAFYPLRNSLDPNQNLFWQIPSADVYAGLTSKRQEVWRQAVNAGIQINRKDSNITVSSASAKLLSLAGVKYLTTPYPLDRFDLVATPSADPSVLLYQNPRALPHAYLTTDYLVAQNIPDLLQKLTDPQSSAVILEKPVNLASQSTPIGQAVIAKNTDLAVWVETASSRAALLVLSDSYYPGWEATVNDSQAKILPVNLNQRAVIIPPGNHLVKFLYRPFADLIPSLSDILSRR